MADWVARLKRFFDRQRDVATPPAIDLRPHTPSFLNIIELDDPEVIESARDEVRQADIAPLIALYWQLNSWPARRALVELLQDQFHPDMPKMMLDFLRVPDPRGDERTELAQAIALGFVAEKYDRYMTYSQDRRRLAQDVAEVLRTHGLSAEPSADPPPSPPPAAETPPDPGKSPNQRLMDAAIAGQLPAVKQALQAGANVNVVISGGDYEGCSALIMALMRQHFDVAEYLIDQGADVNHTRPARHTPDRTRGQTPLWWAANHGHAWLATKLLACGADVNTPDHHGSTPLTQAASSGHREMVRFLVDSGADVGARIYDGRSAFNLAVTHGHTRVAEYLLTVGSNPNESGSSGYTPLMVAAESNYYDLAELLIGQGADVNAVHPGRGIYVGLRGWTPLVFAVRAGLVRMTRLLIQAGADVSYRVPAGPTYRGEALPARSITEFAVGKRAESVMKLLREAGADAA